MKRVAIVAAGWIFVGAAYVSILIALGSNPQEEGGTFATLAFPVLVGGILLTGYIAWESYHTKDSRMAVSDLSAQLVRKEIELDRMSTVDELTGLYTRHHFDDNIRLEYKRSERYSRALSLLLLEVDDLTALGENVGKLSKGYLLSEIGAILRISLRVNDLGCRYGAETMAVLLPEATAAQALVVAEKVRAKVAEHEFLGFAEGVHVTVSQGIASIPATDITSHQDLLRAAEAALVSARASGFDQVAIHEPEPPEAAQQLAS